MTGETLPLIDHHVHGIVAGPLDDAGVEILLTEASELPDPGISVFDSQLGFAVRRWCAPLLDLEPSAPADRYLQRRAELGADEVNGRLLRAAAGRVVAGGQRLPDRPGAHPGPVRRGQRHASARDRPARGGRGAGGQGRDRRGRLRGSGSLPRSPPRPGTRSGSSPSSPTGTGWTSIRRGRAPPRSRDAAGRWLPATRQRTRRPASRTRSCSGTASGPGWTPGCRSSSTWAWATPTCGCTGRTRR